MQVLGRDFRLKSPYLILIISTFKPNTYVLRYCIQWNQMKFCKKKRRILIKFFFILFCSLKHLLLLMATVYVLDIFYSVEM